MLHANQQGGRSIARWIYCFTSNEEGRASVSLPTNQLHPAVRTKKAHNGKYGETVFGSAAANAEVANRMPVGTMKRSKGWMNRNGRGQKPFVLRYCVSICIPRRCNKCEFCIRFSSTWRDVSLYPGSDLWCSVRNNTLYSCESWKKIII